MKILTDEGLNHLIELIKNNNSLFIASSTILNAEVVDSLPEVEEENVLYLVKEVVKEDDGNLYDPLTAPVLNAYISTSSKIFSSSENVDKSTYLQIEPNTTYKITKTAGATFSIGTCPDEPSSYTSLTVAQKNANGSEQTITSGATDNYLAIFYYTEGEDTLTEEELRNSIVVTVEPEEPTTTNLWENATIMHEYFFDTDKSILDYKDGVNYYSAYIPCESNTQYKITRTMDGYRFRIANTSVTPAQGVSYSNYLKADSLKDIDYTTSSDAQYLVIYYVGSSETLDPTELFNDISITKVS